MWLRRTQAGNNNNNVAVEPPYSCHFALAACDCCNVYRELDRGTAYFHAQMVCCWDAQRDAWTAQSWLETVLWASYVYRQVNRLESFVAFGGIPQSTEVSKFVALGKKTMDARGKFFTGAHQTCNLSNLSKWLGMMANGGSYSPQFHAVVDTLLQAKNVKEALQALQKLSGIKSFFSWQILCDLRESKCLQHLAGADFCELGPGAKSTSIHRLFVMHSVCDPSWMIFFGLHSQLSVFLSLLHLRA